MIMRERLNEATLREREGRKKRFLISPKGSLAYPEIMLGEQLSCQGAQILRESQRIGA